MHLLTIVYGPTGTIWSFLFKTPQLADKTFTDLEIAKNSKAEIISVFDDFSHKAVLDVAGIHGFQLEDTTVSQLGDIERLMHHERTIARTKQQLSADPGIRAAMAAQGPAILSPMGNGRFS